MFSQDTKISALSRFNARQIAEAFAYIEQKWPELTMEQPVEDGTLVGLPHPFVVPSIANDTGFAFQEMYYWDSYFIAIGLIAGGHDELAEGMLENLLVLARRFHIIPNASRTYFTGRSQPPLLTTFIFDVYDKQEKGNAWLSERLKVAEREYRNVWMEKAHPNWRNVFEGLSRYYDVNLINHLAEAESGWDMTPRFDRRALHFLPVDLNALLYKYETDFARAARIFDDKREAAKWDDAAELRKAKINKLMWDRNRGMYYDYNFIKEKRGNTSSLAAFFPMWAGMVDEKQAASLVKALRRFEHKGGLSTTDTLPIGQFVLGSLPTQWSYPNGWAPLHFIVIKALERYGYHADARRIAMKWLKANLQWFFW